MVTVNDEQQLYVIEVNGGYTCLGFEIAYRKASDIADWLMARRIQIEKPNRNNIGIIAGYNDYERLCKQASDYCLQTKTRCDVELHPQLHQFLNKRIQVTTKDGEKQRFIVGKSMGWMPIYLRIENDRSRGGEAISRWEEFTDIRIAK